MAMDFAPDSSALQRARDGGAALFEQLRTCVSETWLLNAQVQLSLASGYLQMLRTTPGRATRFKLYERAIQLHEAALRGRDKVALSMLPTLDPQRFQDLEHGLTELSAKLAEVLGCISAML
jgi:hypothetical protein